MEISELFTKRNVDLVSLTGDLRDCSDGDWGLGTGDWGTGETGSVDRFLIQNLYVSAA